MKISERNIIIKHLEKIKGAKNIKIGRAANLIWIALKGIDGKDYALHLQTFFRLCDTEKILITDSDKYQPTSLIASNPSFNIETFDWDEQGSNLLDEWSKSFNTNLLNNLIVEDVIINVFGDLKILFSCNITLTVLLDTTSNDECWRFFEWHSKNRHLVVTGREVQDLEEWLDEPN